MHIALIQSISTQHSIEFSFATCSKLNFTISMIEFNTYNHFAAYLAGILVAALVHRSHKITLPKVSAGNVKADFCFTKIVFKANSEPCLDDLSELVASGAILNVLLHSVG